MALAAIADWLGRTTGIDATILGDQRLQRAVQARMATLQEPSQAAYQQRLDQGGSEAEALVESLVVPETWFFRDDKPFEVLQRHALARSLRRGQDEPLRMLSAPCSSGEEPYSMVIAMRELGLPRQAYTVQAIDISRQALERAQHGLYGRNALRNLSENRRRLHFSAAGNAQLLHAEIRQHVQFQQANLLTFFQTCTASYDVIFCRNVLIYLHPAARQAILADLSRVLVPGGLLVVGSAEMAMVPEGAFQNLGQAFSFAFQRRQAGEAQSSPPKPQPPERRRAAAEARPRTFQPASAGRSLREQVDASDPARAMRLCQEQLNRDPAHAESYLLMAQLHQQAEQFQPALDCLRRCLYLDPDLEPALEALRDLNRQLGMEQQAQQLQARLERRRRAEPKP